MLARFDFLFDFWSTRGYRVIFRLCPRCLARTETLASFRDVERLQRATGAAILSRRNEHVFGWLRLWQLEKVLVVEDVDIELILAHAMTFEELQRLRHHQRFDMCRQSLVLYDLVWNCD